MHIVKHVMNTSGSVAKDLGGRSVDLARSIGLKRGLIGLAIAGAATGGAIVLFRFLRQRRAGDVALADGVIRRKAKHNNAKPGVHAAAH